MRENPMPAGWPLHALELDVARSRVCLAALKIKAGLKPSDQQLAAASVVLSHYRRRLETLRKSPAISDQIIPDAATRSRLLTAIQSATNQDQAREAAANIKTLDELIDLLSELNQKRTLDGAKAKCLLSRIDTLEPQSTITL